MTQTAKEFFMLLYIWVAFTIVKVLSFIVQMLFVGVVVLIGLGTLLGVGYLLFLILSGVFILCLQLLLLLI